MLKTSRRRITLALLLGLFIAAGLRSHFTAGAAGMNDAKAQVVFDVDLTKGDAGKGVVKGGAWDKGWRVTGDDQRIVWDAGYPVRNGALEVHFTMSQPHNSPPNTGKINWVALYENEVINHHNKRGDIFGLRAGEPRARWSKLKAWVEDGGGQRVHNWEQPWGEVGDWTTDDKTVMTVKLEWKNGEGAVYDVRGRKADCKDCKGQLDRLRYVVIGGDTLLPPGATTPASLKGARYLRVKLVDYDRKPGA
jgi:hypothetical protein